MRRSIRFVRNGRVVELRDIRPDLILLDYLRLVERVTGTKASCERGACGACTVAIGRLHEGRLVYQPVQACTLLMVQTDGCEIVTIEDIAEDDGTLHPVQAALVETHATQCGYCTPGMAMSLFVLHQSTRGAISEAAARAAISGNLCRCTGYRPIVDAAVKSSSHRHETRLDRARGETEQLLASLADEEDLQIGTGERFIAAPTSLDRAGSLYDEHAGNLVVVGQDRLADEADRQPHNMLLLSRVPEARRIESGTSELVLGAAVTLEEAIEPLSSIDVDIGSVVRRIGGPQSRTTATVAEAVLASRSRSPLLAVLVALEAEATFLRDGKEQRLPVASIFRKDGRVDREQVALMVDIRIPRPRPRDVVRMFTVGRRWDNAEVIISGAFLFRLDEGGLIETAAIAFAGHAAAPRRAAKAEAALIGAGPVDRSVWPAAFAALREDFHDVGDRAKARYRVETVQALLGKALIEAGGSSDRRTRLSGYREAARDAAG